MSNEGEDDDDESSSTDFLQFYLTNLQNIEDAVVDIPTPHLFFATNSPNATTMSTAIGCHNNIKNSSNNNNGTTLEELVQILPTVNNIDDVNNILMMTMGNMALCRGENGKRLHRAGAVRSLMQLFYRFMHHNNNNNNNDDDDYDNNHNNNNQNMHHHHHHTQVLLSIFAAIRDLSCGNALIRADFFPLLPDLTRFLLQRPLIIVRSSSYLPQLEAEEGVNNNTNTLWLKLQTALVGTLRNLAHSNGRNGRRLHELGLTEFLVSYLLDPFFLLLHNRSPPCPSSPDRELYFRAVGTILAIVEKVDAAIPVAMKVTDQCLIMMDSSSSAAAAAATTTKKKLYHPGLWKLIRASHELQPQYRFAIMLEQEAMRQASERQRCSSNTTTNK